MDHLRSANDGDNPQTTGGSHEPTRQLPDVGHLPLAELVGSTDTALDTTLRRLLDDLRHGPGSYTAFANAVP